MKKILLLIVLLLTVNLFAQVTRYVNGNATGGVYDGLSWNTGWRTFSAINWGSLTPGSTLYISGGVSSVTYNEQLTPGTSGTRAKFIKIFAGKYSPSPSGHSGRVIINASGAQSIYIQYKNYLWIKGLELTNAVKGVHINDGAKYVVFDSLNIYGYTGQAGIFLNGASKGTLDSCVIRNCRIESPAIYNGQTDGMYFQQCTRILAYDNWVHQRNQDPAAHTDGIQGNNNAGAVFYNNYSINDSVNSPEGGGTPMIFGFDGASPNNYNIMVANSFLYMGGIWYPTGSQNCCWWSRSYENQTTVKCWLLNNTIIVNGPRCRGAEFQYQTYASNNIIAMYSGPTMGNIEENLPNSIYVDSTRNNIFYKEGGNPSFSGSFIGHNGLPTGTPNATTWLTTYGGTGQMVDPKLVDNIGHISDQGTLGPELQSNSPAIDAGNNVFNSVAYMNWVSNQGFDNVHSHQNETIAAGIYGGIVKWRLPSDRDINNNPISGGIRDVGAFEYGVAGWIPPDTTAVVVIDTLKNVELGSYHIGSGVLSGADSTFHIWTATADSFRVTGGTFNTTMVSAVSGNTLYIPVIASNQYSTSVTNYVVVSGTTRSFTVTTKAFQGGGGTINGGWLSGSNNKKIYLPNGHALITRQP
jgi:hypothetical protein